MPCYKGVLTLEDQGPDTPVVHLFDYTADDDQPTSKSSYRKQVIALESSIYLGTFSLAVVKSQSQGISKATKDQSGKRAKSDFQESTNGETEESGETPNEKQTNGEVKATKVESKEEEEKVKETAEGTKKEEEVEAEEMSEKEVKEENVKEVYLKEGQEFQGCILQCPNGPYDYAMKLWDKGRAVPPEVEYPKEGQEQAAVVVDRTEDLLTVACGPHIAFARKKAFLCAGVDPDDLSLPFARLKVSLRRLQEGEAVVPAAGWEALPTQIVVAPYDIY